jgi:dihydroorotase
MSDVNTLEEVNRAAIASGIEANPGLIRGFKMRLVGPVAQNQGRQLIDLVKEITREHHLPLMVHFGDRTADFTSHAEVTKHMLNSFDPGDIITHLATPHSGGMMATEERNIALPELLEARDRGVVLDPALGAGNFGFDLARTQSDIGLHPDTISSDLTAGGQSRVVYSLLECIGRYMAVGYTVRDMVRMATANAAQALGMQDEIGALAVGREADISVIEEANGRWGFVDTLGQDFTGEKALQPVLTVRAGEVFTPGWGPHPWGWLPPEA